jgi:hypothetical protein
MFIQSIQFSNQRLFCSIIWILALQKAHERPKDIWSPVNVNIVYSQIKKQ